MDRQTGLQTNGGQPGRQVGVWTDGWWQRPSYCLPQALAAVAELTTWLEFYFLAPCLVLGKGTGNGAVWGGFFLAEKQAAAVNSLTAVSAPAPQLRRNATVGSGQRLPLRLQVRPAPPASLSPPTLRIIPVLPAAPLRGTLAWALACPGFPNGRPRHGAVSPVGLFPRCLMGWGGLWGPPPSTTTPQPCSDFAQPGIKVHSWARASPPC